MGRQKTVLITGATGAIGKAIASGMAEENYNIVLVCRDKHKAQLLTNELKVKSRSQDIAYRIADLSLQKEIIAFASSWDKPIDILINNAAATPRKRMETQEGIELQFATNVLGYFWMMYYLQSFLKEAGISRIVNVASYWAGGLDINDLEFKNRSYDNNSAYRQSKQADRMISKAFAERFKSDNIFVNACHPGDVNSALSNNLGFGGHQSPEQGAATPLMLAKTAIGGEVTGKYFEHDHEMECHFSKDMEKVERLFLKCMAYKI